MKFSFLSLHLFDINFLIVLSLIKYSDCQSDIDWTKKNDVVYRGPKFVNEGETFLITCWMSQFNAPKWTKNDFGITEDNRISYENKVGVELTRVETLIVTNASAIDSGFYRCNSFSRTFHQIEVITSQPITQIPDSSTQSNTDFVEIKEEFSTVVLNCKTDSNDSKILWFKNGKKVEADTRRVANGSRLIINEATSSVDAGRYLCQIENFSGRGSSQIGQVIELRAPIRIKPFESPQSIVIGRKYQLECVYTGYPFGKIKWIVGNEVLSEQMMKELNIRIEPNRDTLPQSVLIISNVSQSHSSSYTCQVNNGYSQDEASAIITVREGVVNSQDPILLIENKPLIISCNFTDDNNQNELIMIKWGWLKDGTPHSDLPEEQRQRITIRDSDHSLVISKAHKNDTGIWRCFDSTGGRAAHKDIKVLTKPWLIPFEEYQKTNYKSANLVEGQTFTLRCAVIEGYGKDVSLSWHRYKESDHGKEDLEMEEIKPDPPHLTINDTELLKQVLTIDKVVPSDRFYYVCEANNGFVNTSNTILLRVKDKLGALWPFLGIVAEVVILCTIIFIYEKRRIKPDFDETENDNNTEPKGAQDRSSKTQDVRQRK